MSLTIAAEIAAEIERYLRTGETDDLADAWPGDIMDRGRPVAGRRRPTARLSSARSPGLAAAGAATVRLAIALAIAACGTPSAPTVIPPKPLVVAPNPIPSAPVVDAEAALLPEEGAPPVVVIVDADSRRSVAAAATWKDIATGTFVAGPKSAAGRNHLRALSFAWQTDKKQSPTVLVEKLETWPVPAREPEHHEPQHNPAYSLRKGEVDVSKRDDDDPRATRQARVVGQIDNELDAHPAVVVAAPTGKAALLVEAVAESMGHIGVLHRGSIRRLRFQFVLVPYVWTFRLNDIGLELVVSKAGTQIETPKHPPVPVTADKLAAAIAEANKRIDKRYVNLVDVLVAPDVTAQQLVDTLVALDQAGVKWIGLGHAPQPGSEQWKFRRERIVRVGFGKPWWNPTWDHDTSAVRSVVDKERDAFLACYDAALAKDPDLQVSGQIQIGVTKDNKAIFNASGYVSDNEALGNCLTGAVAKLKPPKPDIKGDIVWLHYPIHFRQ